MEHLDLDVRNAIIKLTDALCTWERNTGIKNVLIIKEERGFNYRAVNGKPNVPDDIPNNELLKIIT